MTADCQLPCDAECEIAPVHCWNWHRPRHKPDWHDPIACGQGSTARRVNWRKATASGTGNCVEVAHCAQVHIRDSKRPADGYLTVSRTAFAALAADIRNGSLEMPGKAARRVA